MELNWLSLKSKASKKDKKDILSSLANFSDKDVRLVIIPRADMKYLDISTSVTKASQFMAEHQLDSVVVCRGSLDQATGILTAKSLLKAINRGNGTNSHRSISPFLDKIIPIPVSMRRVDAFYEMARREAALAVVCDEHGGVDGCVTLRGLIDSLTQSLAKAHQADDAQDLVQQEDGSFIVDSRLHLEVLEEQCGLLFKKEKREGIDSVGGLVVSLAGHIPARGEVIRHSSGWHFEVTKVDARRVHQLRLVPAADKSTKKSES